MEKYLIAHDLGTSGDKATLFSTDGRMIKSITCVYETHFFNSTWAEQNPFDWWNAFCCANHALLKDVDKTRVAGIAFSGQMMGCVVVDRNGEVLRPAIIWADQRSIDEERVIREGIEEWEFYRITGHRISASYSIEKLMWIKNHEPDIYAKTYKMLQPKDYMIYRLTGEFLTDYTDASGTNCMDLSNLCWSDYILDIAGIDRDKLTEIQSSTYVAGEIGTKICEECGLPQGTPVVIGAGDGLCAAVGAGSVEDGDTFNYLGSSSWVALTTSKPIFDKEMKTYNWAHMIKGKYSPNGTMQAAGNSYQFLRKILCKDLEEKATLQKNSVYELMNLELGQSEQGANGLVYLPYILGERSPRWNSEARGAFIGLKMEHERKDLIRAGIEGIIMNLSIILDVFQNDRVNIQAMNVIGGLAKSKEIRQILSDVYGLEIRKLNWVDEATSMGAAVAAGVGVGEFRDFNEISKFIEIEDVIYPDKARYEKYKKLKEIFNQSYYALLQTYKSLSQWKMEII